MTINRDAVGVESDWFERSWTANDCLLYALGVGAGEGDPTGAELAFTTDNSEAIGQQVLPTFATIVGGPSPMSAALGDFDHSMLLHGEEETELFGTVPPVGSTRSRSKISAIHDKGSGAVVVTETETLDAETGERRWVTRRSAFIRGEGGWTRTRTPVDEAAAMPAREPDLRVCYATRPAQALLYRLSGDHNPIHSDPVAARRAGFEKPILHGLCTYGFAGRALLHALCGSDPARLSFMRARFTQSVAPGETLITKIWVDGPRAQFRVETDADKVVLDRGECRFDNSPTSPRTAERKVT